MTTVARRTKPFADVLEWLDTGMPFAPRFGLVPSVRVEDFVEDGMYVVRAELPGIDPEKDVHVQVVDETLVIHGERREEHADKRRQEFHYGSFSRSIPLPPGVSSTDIKASYADGVLEVRFPAKTAEATTVEVPVTRAA